MSCSSESTASSNKRGGARCLTQGSDPPQSGEKSKSFGVYKSVWCGAEIAINADVVFPDCPNHPEVSTTWKSVQEKIIEIANNSQSGAIVEGHISNRRLFDVAAGRLRLEAQEQEHLHGCNVCQCVLHVFIRQPLSVVPKDRLKSRIAKPKDAA